MNQMDPILTAQLLMAEHERRARDARLATRPMRRVGRRGGWRDRWRAWRTARPTASGRRAARRPSALWRLRGIDDCPTCS